MITLTELVSMDRFVVAEPLGRDNWSFKRLRGRPGTDRCVDIEALLMSDGSMPPGVVILGVLGWLGRYVGELRSLAVNLIVN